MIAFSNSRYYENRLITFPAPVHPDRGVRLVRPSGFYARGKARHNEGEARAVVAEVVRRLTSDDEGERKRSIGVVTFNVEQQSLIEDLLDKERANNPRIEWAFAETRQEPVFVKNLETVQGDERDVILFSVTYGPDQSGHVTMNFGPLNRDGGERRLNVAMTRAREEMIVFSTLHPDSIDLSRTNSEAVRDLKHFLEYAERGPAAIAESVHGPREDCESPFEAAVARALCDRGWNVHSQVGVSAYRIDLGVVHPDAPGAYLAGVECDGAMYHSAAVARERDRIRQLVLEGLGWTLFRVWSTDWWIDSAGAVDTLDRQLRDHLESERRRRKEVEEATAASPTVPQGTEAELANEDALGGDGSTTAGPAANKDFPTPTPLELPDGSLVASRPGASARRAPLERPVPPGNELFAFNNSGEPEDRHRYAKARLDKQTFFPEPARFYAEDYEARLSAMIDHVIDMEGPVHEDVLVYRIARHHGFQRAGRQIRDLVSRVAKKRRGHTREDVGLFFWRKRTVKDRLAPARYTDRDDETRDVDHICAEELRAIASVLELGNDVTALARALGIGRLGQQARQRLETALRD